MNLLVEGRPRSIFRLILILALFKYVTIFGKKRLQNMRYVNEFYLLVVYVFVIPKGIVTT
jgi:hypothetical protein